MSARDIPAREIYSDLDIDRIRTSLSNVRTFTGAYTQVESMGVITVNKGHINVSTTPIEVMDQERLPPPEALEGVSTVVQLYDPHENGSMCDDGLEFLDRLLKEMAPCTLWDPEEGKAYDVQKTFVKKCRH